MTLSLKVSVLGTQIVSKNYKYIWLTLLGSTEMCQEQLMPAG